MLVLILSAATISSALQNGKSVSLVGFGTFAVKACAARDGRNPQTGATIKIAAASVTLAIQHAQRCQKQEQSKQLTQTARIKGVRQLGTIWCK